MSVPVGTVVRIQAEMRPDEVWEYEVYVDRNWAGSGTTPRHFLDGVSEILYGDTNDHLNEWYGALGDLDDR